MMPKPELVSVIIPVHNRLKYLSECLSSVAQQTYTRVEVIIVDDASTIDITPIIWATNWPDDMEIRYIRNEKKLGPGASREVGRREATGDYLCYLDSDDCFHPDKLRLQVEALKSNAEAGMCYCTSLIFQSFPLTGQERIRSKSDQRFRNFLPEVLCSRPWGTAACLWTKDAVDQIGPWYESWTWEDYEYDVRAGCHDVTIAFVPHVLCYYRKHESPERLSKQPLPELRRSRCLSILQISQNLRRFDKVGNTLVRTRLIRLLYDHAIYMIEDGEQRLAVSCLWQLIQLASRNPILVGLFSLLGVQQFIFSRSFTGRIARKGRKLLPCH